MSKKMTKKGENNTLTKSVVFEDEMFLEIKEMMKASGNGFSFVINEVLEKGLLNIEYEKVSELNKNLNEEIERKDFAINDFVMTLKSIERIIIEKEEQNGNNKVRTGITCRHSIELGDCEKEGSKSDY